MPNASARFAIAMADAAEADDAHARAAHLARERHRPVRPGAAAHVAVGFDAGGATTARTSAIARSATSSLRTFGVWVTAMPRSRAAATSTPS